MRLRIVRDQFCGYEVQVWRWWWPFWIQADFCNTHLSIEAAERWAEAYSKPVVKHLSQKATRQESE